MHRPARTHPLREDTAAQARPASRGNAAPRGIRLRDTAPRRDTTSAPRGDAGTKETFILTLDLKGKKVIAIGERDGVQGMAIAAVAERLGAEVVFNITQCFV